MPIYRLSYWLSNIVLDEFLSDCNSGLYFMYSLFFHFLFWKYSFDSYAKKIRIVEELSWGKKCLNFILFFLLLLVVGFVLGPMMELYTWTWLLNYLSFFSLLILFLFIRNYQKHIAQ